MTLEDRYFEIKDDPRKRARAFKVIMIVSYGMLILGAFLVVWALVKGL